MSAVSEFRKKVRTTYPHVKVSVRTVDFTDLARASAQFVKITGDRTIEELIAINGWAKEAGILPDTNVRFYGPPGERIAL